MYITLLSTMILYSLAIKKSKKFSHPSQYAFLIFTGLFFLYVILALISLAIGIRELMTIFQKLGRFSIYAGFTILTIGAWKID